jgi:amidase
MTFDESGFASSGALRCGPALLARGAEEGPLAGCTTVIKDLFDIAGQKIAAGNPDWLAAHASATANAWAVQRWLDAGASVIGIAHTDELALSLSGTNVHYGTPVNPRAPDRVPGGSSSGSVVAVASGLVDFALGTDTGGSTRVPASYCGVHGIRTSHGRIPLDGAVRLAPRFDTAGIFARTGQWLKRATLPLLTDARTPSPTSGIVLAMDVLNLAHEDTAKAVEQAAERLAEALDLPLDRADLGDGRLDTWRQAFAARQMADVWATHGAWITAHAPSFGPGIAARFADASRADLARGGLADVAESEIHEALDRILPPGAVLAYASAFGPAPLIDEDTEKKLQLRVQTIAMTCIAGLGRLPAISLPLAEVDGLPVGLCLVARPGEDERLLDIAERADALTSVPNLSSMVRSPK